MHVAATNSTICKTGTGETCNESETESLSSQVTLEFTSEGQYLPVTNCGTRIYSHGAFSTKTVIDQASGLPISYDTQINNYLDWSIGLQASVNAEPKYLTPFVDLSKLRDLKAANLNVTLSKISQTFAVNSENFLNVQYPVSTTEPTVTYTITYPGTAMENSVVVWALIVWIVAIVLSGVGIIASAMKIMGGSEIGEDMQALNPSSDNDGITYN